MGVMASAGVGAVAVAHQPPAVAASPGVVGSGELIQMLAEEVLRLRNELEEKKAKKAAAAAGGGGVAVA
jgi:hypothetical protein